MANVMLPKQIDPIQLADNQKNLKGKLALSEMDRLMELVCNRQGSAFIDLSFGRDELGYRYMRGSIKAGFEVICQRCNQPMHLDLTIDVEESPVKTDEEAERLPRNYDPLLLTGDTVALYPMVEEEILLSIPIVPKHTPEECAVKVSSLAAEENKEDKHSPFDILKKLLRE
jgi:uncharacterized protein